MMRTRFWGVFLAPVHGKSLLPELSLDVLHAWGHFEFLVLT